MRKSIMLVLATALASPMLISTGAFSPADARVTLNQCIGNRSACEQRCVRTHANAIPWTNDYYHYQLCYAACQSNHAACVDFAMSQMTAVDGGTKPPRRPRGNTVAPTGALLDRGLLQPNWGFGTQAPAPTGRPAAPQSR